MSVPAEAFKPIPRDGIEEGVDYCYPDRGSYVQPLWGTKSESVTTSNTLRRVTVVRHVQGEGNPKVLIEAHEKIHNPRPHWPTSDHGFALTDEQALARPVNHSDTIQAGQQVICDAHHISARWDQYGAEITRHRTVDERRKEAVERLRAAGWFDADGDDRGCVSVPIRALLAREDELDALRSAACRLEELEGEQALAQYDRARQELAS